MAYPTEPLDSLLEKRETATTGSAKALLQTNNGGKWYNTPEKGPCEEGQAPDIPFNYPDVRSFFRMGGNGMNYIPSRFPENDVQCIIPSKKMDESGMFVWQPWSCSFLENTADEVKFKNITGSTGDTGTLTTDRFTGCNQTHAFGTLSRQCLTVFGFDF